MTTQISTIFLEIFIAINFVLLLAFFLGTKFLFNLKSDAMFKQRYATFLGFILLFYFVAIILLAFSGLFTFLIFLLIPFAITKYIDYKKLYLYANFHILLFLTSLFLAFWQLRLIITA